MLGFFCEVIYHEVSMKTKLLVFGLTGDLGRRKLLPAFSRIVATGDFDDLEIIGVSRRGVDVGELLGGVKSADNLLERASIYTMDLARAEDYVRLKDHLRLQSDEQLIVYLSVPPLAATQIVDFMGEAGINSSNVKLLFEKPFGVDLESAREVIARTARYYQEEQIYRIDHYLAKEMAQNIIAVRGRNAMFSHLWDKRAIEKVEVISLESIGVEGRGAFYEQTGALRDVVQGHLMQLLALVLADIPAEFDWTELPQLRLEALNSIMAVDPGKAKRAQYQGYQEEVANPGSLVETYVSVELESADEQWQGVPLQMTTGKAMHQKTTEIRIHFRKTHEAQNNQLVFRIQPNEGVEIEMFTKVPGYDYKFEKQLLNFTYPEDLELPDAYEQVIVDAIRSKKSLFTSSFEVIRSWQILQPLLDSWAMESRALGVYKQGAAINEVNCG